MSARPLANKIGLGGPALIAFLQPGQVTTGNFFFFCRAANIPTAIDSILNCGKRTCVDRQRRSDDSPPAKRGVPWRLAGKAPSAARRSGQVIDAEPISA